MAFAYGLILQIYQKELLLQRFIFFLQPERLCMEYQVCVMTSQPYILIYILVCVMREAPLCTIMASSKIEQNVALAFFICCRKND
jgi:hypothetical protein